MHQARAERRAMVSWGIAILVLLVIVLVLNLIYLGWVFAVLQGLLIVVHWFTLKANIDSYRRLRK